MKQHLVLMGLLILGAFATSRAQVNESFSDGDFTSNPAWVGGTTDFQVNASNQLQSGNAVANSSFYLSTANTLATTVQWDVNINLTFNTSSTNYVDVYLIASASDLSLAGTVGYFVRLGNTNDDISLYRKDASGNTLLIDGLNGTLNTSNNTVRLRVIRDAANQFTLFRDLTGTGSTFSSEGSVTDATYTTTAFFGFFVKQSTASFFTRHFFDDVQIQAYVPDTTPPIVQSATALSATAVDVLFNEPLNNISSQVAANYSANNGLGAAATAVLDATNTALVHLTFSTSIPNGTNCLLTVNGVEDLAGNAISNGTATFSFYTPQQYDVVIDELMADPTPEVGLPNAEWLELRNTSGFAINLNGWKIGDASGTSGALPNFILQPDSTAIICTSSAVALLSPFGRVLSVTSFPSLDNTGELLYVLSPQGVVIHALQYSDAWYQNELKKDGGWSLEMIDINNPCSGIGNWTASTDNSGGTPGRINSVAALNADAIAPKLVKAFAADPLHISLFFDEPLDSTSAGIASRYSVSDGLGSPTQAIAIGPLFNSVQLTLASPLLNGKVYVVTATSVTDCVGNSIGSSNTARVGLADLATNFDVIVNEILFNPPSNGSDYVEIYNRSNKIVNLQQTYIANRGTNGAVSSIVPISNSPLLLFPQDFMVLTEDVGYVKTAFLAKNPDAFVTVESMPSFNDDASSVILLNAQGNVMDEITYNEKWHFKLIDNREGVSLERISYSDTTKDDPSTLENEQSRNWHSAATSVGYGTPTYQNSQYLTNLGVVGTITTSPQIVSPDNDGQDDFLTIQYEFPTAGYVANITVFDASGRPVRYLQRNALCGTKGFFRWDGLSDKNLQLSTGVYIIYTEVFNLEGKTKQYKNTVVLARRN